MCGRKLGYDRELRTGYVDGEQHQTGIARGIRGGGDVACAMAAGRLDS